MTPTPLQPGTVYGRLTIKSEAERPPHLRSPGRYVLCVCECGNERVVSARNLRGGRTRSCGCLAGDRLRRSRTEGIRRARRRSVLDDVVTPDAALAELDAGAAW